MLIVASIVFAVTPLPLAGSARVVNSAVNAIVPSSTLQSSPFDPPVIPALRVFLYQRFSHDQPNPQMVRFVLPNPAAIGAPVAPPPKPRGRARFARFSGSVPRSSHPGTNRRLGEGATRPLGLFPPSARSSPHSREPGHTFCTQLLLFLYKSAPPLVAPHIPNVGAFRSWASCFIMCK